MNMAVVSNGHKMFCSPFHFNVARLGLQSSVATPHGQGKFLVQGTLSGKGTL